MYTAPLLIHPTNPGHVQGNPVLRYHDAFNRNRNEAAELKERYEKGTAGDVEVKNRLVEMLNELIAPMRGRRADYGKDLATVYATSKTERTRTSGRDPTGTSCHTECASLRDRLPTTQFHYHERGALATIGRAAAVAQFGRLKLSGLPAWIVWSVAHIFFLIGFRNRLMVFLEWVWAYLARQRSSRLITGESAGAGSQEA